MLSDKEDYSFIPISTAEMSLLKYKPFYDTVCYIIGRVLFNLLNCKAEREPVSIF